MSINGGKNLTGKAHHRTGITGFGVDLINFRPKEFPKTSAYAEDSDEEESTVGKMPPSDSEDE
jgi:hypothetical protein